MSALVIPLGLVRNALSLAREDANRAARDLGETIVERACTWAERAFKAASGPAHDDAELRQDIYRAAHRRLRADMRRRLGKACRPELKAAVLDQAEIVFRGRVIALDEEREEGQARG